MVSITIIVIRFSYDNLLSVMTFFKGNDQSQYAYMTSDVNPLRILVAVAPILVVLVSRNKLYRTDKEFGFYYMSIFINAGLMIATSGSAYLARVGIYTEAFACIFYPKLLKCFTGESRRFAAVFIMVLFLAFWIVELQARELTGFKWYFSTI